MKTRYWCLTILPMLWEKFIFNDIHQGIKDKVSEKTNKPYKSITDNYRLELTLTDYKGKLLFSSYYVRLIGAIEYKGKRDKLFLEHSFLRTGVQNKHIKKEDRIDIQKSFHEYITPSQTRWSQVFTYQRRTRFYKPIILYNQLCQRYEPYGKKLWQSVATQKRFWNLFWIAFVNC